MKKLCVFEYLDVRAYLMDHQKITEFPWSLGYRGVAQKIGVTKGYFWLCLHGQRPFARKVCEKLPKLLNIPAKEKAYLRVLLYMADFDMEKNLKREIIEKFRPAKYKNAKK
jgi:hypothetical protein